jgi:hypothetical protein
MLPAPDSGRLTNYGWQGATADALEGSLWIRFTDGTTGYYDGVPLDLFAQMRLAPSKGQFLSQQIIKAGYQFIRAELPPEAQTQTSDTENSSGA